MVVLAELKDPRCGTVEQGQATVLNAGAYREGSPSINSGGLVVVVLVLVMFLVTILCAALEVSDGDLPLGKGRLGALCQGIHISAGLREGSCSREEGQEGEGVEELHCGSWVIFDNGALG